MIQPHESDVRTCESDCLFPARPNFLPGDQRSFPPGAVRRICSISLSARISMQRVSRFISILDLLLVLPSFQDSRLTRG